MSLPAPAWMSWTMWGLVASFYMVGFFQRVAPAVMVDELMRDFHIGGALLGNLSAAYFYSYAVMQIPSGLLADGDRPEAPGRRRGFAGRGRDADVRPRGPHVDGLRGPPDGRGRGRRRVRHLHEARRALVRGQPVRHGDGRGAAGRQLRRRPRGRAAFGSRGLLRLADRDGWRPRRARSPSPWPSGRWCGTIRASAATKASPMPRSPRAGGCLPCAHCAA